MCLKLLEFTSFTSQVTPVQWSLGAFFTSAPERGRIMVPNNLQGTGNLKGQLHKQCYVFFSTLWPLGSSDPNSACWAQVWIKLPLPAAAVLQAGSGEHSLHLGKVLAGLTSFCTFGNISNHLCLYSAEHHSSRKMLSKPPSKENYNLPVLIRVRPILEPVGIGSTGCRGSF